MTPEAVIGDNVRVVREQLGWTQQQLGDALAEYLGKPWPRQAVWAAENGQRDWKAVELWAVSIVLGKAPSWLLYPKLRDDLEFPSGVTVDSHEVVTMTVTKDSPPLNAAAELAEQLRQQLVEIGRQVDAAGSKAVVMGAMYTRAIKEVEE